MLFKECKQVVRAVPLQKEASVHEKRIIPVDSKDFRYLRFRAIGNLEKAGFNGNFDGFPYQWFEDERPGFGYKSFINKRAHYEHNSSKGITGSIGDLPDAFLNRFRLPEDIKHYSDLQGSSNHSKRASILELPDQTRGDIEVLMRIDTTLSKNSSTDKNVRDAIDRITRAIDTGQQLTCSMGCNVAYSTCTVCGNNARFSNEYCSHMKGRKGALHVVAANSLRDNLDKDLLRPEWLKWIVASAYDIKEILQGITNKGIAVRAAEINHENSFFELSIVGNPAYVEAWALEKVASITDSRERKEYIRKVAQNLGQNLVVDLFEVAKENGWITSSCMVG